MRSVTSCKGRYGLRYGRYGGGTGTGAAPVIGRIAKEEIKALTIRCRDPPVHLEGPSATVWLLKASRH